MGRRVYRPAARPPRNAARGFRLLERLRSGPPIVLDGAIGTELERRGAFCGLPLWSSHALLDDPSLVERVHRDYVAAGAELLTANTFRTQRRTLARAGLEARTAEFVERAVQLARRACEGATGEAVLGVAGSMGPLEDCYRPELVPDDESLAREHAEQAQHLAAAGVDCLLVETMNTIREAVAAARAAAATGVPVLVSLVADATAHLPSGEPLEGAVDAVARLDPAVVLVNCLPPSAVPACLTVLRASGRRFGVYANLGAPLDAEGRRRTEPLEPEAFAERAMSWAHAGACVVGGCCGTTPRHVRALARRLSRRVPSDAHSGPGGPNGRDARPR